ncbi:MAG TPA: DMT family transporter [Planctomycetota bacterium]
MLLGAAAFAVMATLSRAAADRCDWRIVTLARAGLMLVFAAALAWARRVPLVFPGPRTLWLRSAAGSAAIFCTFYAYTHLPVGDAATLVNMVPVWVTLLSWPVLGVKPGGRVWAAVAACLAGVVLIAEPHFKAGSLGAAAAVASSVFTAVVMMSLSRLGDMDPRAVVVHFSVFATAATGAIFLASPEAVRQSATLSAGTVGMLLSLAFAGTIGQIALTRAFGQGSPPRVALVGMTQIPMAVLLEILFLGRSYNARSVAGMALVVAPTAWLLFRRPTPPAES